MNVNMGNFNTYVTILVAVWSPFLGGKWWLNVMVCCSLSVVSGNQVSFGGPLKLVGSVK